MSSLVLQESARLRAETRELGSLKIGGADLQPGLEAARAERQMSAKTSRWRLTIRPRQRALHWISNRPRSYRVVPLVVLANATSELTLARWRRKGLVDVEGAIDARVEMGNLCDSTTSPKILSRRH